jgi:GNT-I family
MRITPLRALCALIVVGLIPLLPLILHSSSSSDDGDHALQQQRKQQRRDAAIERRRQKQREQLAANVVKAERERKERFRRLAAEKHLVRTGRMLDKDENAPLAPVPAGFSQDELQQWSDSTLGVLYNEQAKRDALAQRQHFDIVTQSIVQGQVNDQVVQVEDTLDQIEVEVDQANAEDDDKGQNQLISLSAPVASATTPKQMPKETTTMRTKIKPKYKKSDFTIAMVAFNRPHYLREALASLLDVDGIQKSQVVVFQDGSHEGVRAVIEDEFGLRRVQHRRIDDGKQKVAGSVHIARHYRHIFTTLFDRMKLPHAIVVEDDMLFAPDFLGYFAQLAPLLDSDESVWCVSSYNDSGYPHLASDVMQLRRTDFFIGLGWLASGKLWDNEWRSSWPQDHWDHWLRGAKRRKGRQCVFPEVPRNYNIGVRGVHSAEQFWQSFFRRIVLNRHARVPLDYEPMLLVRHEAALRRQLASAVVVAEPAQLFVDYGTLADDAVGGGGRRRAMVVKLALASDDDQLWRKVQLYFGLWIEAKPVRGIHHGLMALHWVATDAPLFLIGAYSRYASEHRHIADAPALPSDVYAKSRARAMHLWPHPTPYAHAAVVAASPSQVGQSCSRVCAAERDRDHMPLQCNEPALASLERVCNHLERSFADEVNTSACTSSYKEPAAPSLDIETRVLIENMARSTCEQNSPSQRRLCTCSPQLSSFQL